MPGGSFIYFQSAAGRLKPFATVSAARSSQPGTRPFICKVRIGAIVLLESIIR